MPGILVSVSAVRISPDLSVARAYLSIFPSEKAEEMIKNINENMKSVRYELGTRVRHQLRIIPELKFCFGLADILQKNRNDLIDNSLRKFTNSLDGASSKMIVLTLYFE